MTPEERATLVAAAVTVRERAHAPYSQFKVGAAILAEGGGVFTGCNVENASYGLTICAERGAAMAAVAAGCRRWRAVAVVAGPPASPCGACRQVLAEFAPDMEVVVAAPDATVVLVTTMDALLPHRFAFGEQPRGGDADR